MLISCIQYYILPCFAEKKGENIDERMIIIQKGDNTVFSLLKFPREIWWTRNVNARGPNKSIINMTSWRFSFSCTYFVHLYLNPEPYSHSQMILGGRNGDAGVQARTCTLWCCVHPVPVLIILSLGVVEEWRWEEGRVARVETGWPSQHPLSTANRWDLTPSSHTNARATWVCSRDCLELVFTATTAESGSGGNSWALRAKTAKVDVVQGGFIKGVCKPSAEAEHTL